MRSATHPPHSEPMTRLGRKPRRARFGPPVSTAVVLAACIGLAACGTANPGRDRATSTGTRAASTSTIASSFCHQAAPLVASFGTVLPHDPAAFSAQLGRTVGLFRAVLPYTTSASIRMDINTVAGADVALAKSIDPRNHSANEARVRQAFAGTQTPAVDGAGHRVRSWIQSRCGF